MGRQRVGEYMRDQIYYVIDDKGHVVFDGTLKVIGNRFKMDEQEIKKVIVKGEKILDSLKIITAYQYNNRNVTKSISVQEHLFNEDGSRKYEYRRGYPNRYKDASCVRFTPL